MAAQSSSGAPESFSTTGSLANARYNHTATLLPSGKVLVAGGFEAIGSAELYDPATGSWSATGNLVVPRKDHTATLLPNGKVLVAGGVNFPPPFGSRTYLASAELYDPATGTWSATGSLTTARQYHTATLLPSGKVLVTGGTNDNANLASAELYDPATGTWSATGSLATARLLHTATSLPSGKVLVVGGVGANGSANTTAEVYNPTTGTWSATGSPATVRAGHSATLLQSGKVLVEGGGAPSGGSVYSSAELYDPATGTWSATGSLITARKSHTASLLPNGKVLVAGGSRADSRGPAIADAELYDPATGTWSATGSLATGRYAHTATSLQSGQVLVAAGAFGFSPTTALASAELYDPPSTGAPTAQLLNISTRLRVQTGDNALIGGFILTGSEAKRIILRAIGPSLAVPGRLENPTLEVRDAGGTLLASNDNWRDTQEAEIAATIIPPSNNLESAIVITLPANNASYTAIVRGKDDATGIGLVEVYDLAQGANSKLANISTRGFVETGDNALIGGFILGPGTSGNSRVIIRAIGPSLPVNGALADPTLELHNGNGDKIASNDNWKINDATGQSQEAEIRTTQVQPSNDLESAILTTLPPDNYTAIVAGQNGGTGVGLVEVYHLQ